MDYSQVTASQVLARDNKPAQGPRAEDLFYANYASDHFAWARVAIRKILSFGVSSHARVNAQAGQDECHA